MPVYLFTYHAYRSWMPDHRRGYVRRGEGILPPDPEMAARYAAAATDEPTVLDRALQRLLLEELQVACDHQRLHLHAGTTEPSHVHALVSRRHDRTWMRVRTGLKTSLSMRLTKASADDHHLRPSGGASRKRVVDQGHLDHLLKTYLPKHSGVAWYGDERGWVG